MLYAPGDIRRSAGDIYAPHRAPSAEHFFANRRSAGANRRLPSAERRPESATIQKGSTAEQIGESPSNAQ